MTEANLFLFLTASLTLIVAPGPDNVLVLMRGIARGRAAVLVSAAGASVGLVVHSTFAAVGLSAVLAQSVTAYSAVKYVGAVYLIYLGLKALLIRDSCVVPEEAAPVALSRIFLQGVLSNVLNPKVALFFPAFLPPFADPGVGALGLLTLGLTFALLTLAVFSLLGFFSGARASGSGAGSASRTPCAGSQEAF